MVWASLFAKIVSVRRLIVSISKWTVTVCDKAVSGRVASGKDKREREREREIVFVCVYLIVRTVIVIHEGQISSAVPIIRWWNRGLLLQASTARIPRHLPRTSLALMRFSRIDLTRSNNTPYTKAI